MASYTNQSKKINFIQKKNYLKKKKLVFVSI